MTELQSLESYMECEVSEIKSNKDYSFAFDDHNFSDRLLCIEIWEEFEDVHVSEAPPVDDVGDLESQKLKRQRIEGSKECSGSELCVRTTNRLVKTKKLHISSAIMASDSPVFHRMFTIGMRVSNDRQVTLKIKGSEEDALMELLRYMYSDSVTVSTIPSLLDLLITADKYHVRSCVSRCCSLISKTSFPPEAALSILELPPSVAMLDVVKPVVHAATKLLFTAYLDIEKCQDKVMSLPPVAIEAILLSDDLEVTSEDVVYDLFVKWAKQNIINEEERKRYLRNQIQTLVRFHYLSLTKLRDILCCNVDIDGKLASDCVGLAIGYKCLSARSLHLAAATKPQLVQRAYKYRPVRMATFEIPERHSVIFLDLKRGACSKMHPSGSISSEFFFLSNYKFALVAECNTPDDGQSCCFGLFLEMQGKETSSCYVEYEIGVRLSHSKGFITKRKQRSKISGGRRVGWRNVFSIEWSDFISNDSGYFKEDMLCIRAELFLR